MFHMLRWLQNLFSSSASSHAALNVEEMMSIRDMLSMPNKFKIKLDLAHQAHFTQSSWMKMFLLKFTTSFRKILQRQNAADGQFSGLLGCQFMLATIFIPDPWSASISFWVLGTVSPSKK